MANNNCSACEDLRQRAPSLIVNGLNNTMVTNLKNDLGLVASDSVNDCTALNDMNDCLVGNEAEEVELYEVCDWKKFMKQFIPNLWTTLKAMIAAICGLWTHVEAVEDQMGDMCSLIDQLISPLIPHWGIQPIEETQKRVCGTATSHVEAHPDDGTMNPYTKHSQGVGIYYTNQIVEKCDGSGKQRLEWIAPYTYMYYMKAGTQYGDLLWKVTKSEALNKIGMSEELWTIFTQSNWTWYETALSPSRQKAWLQIGVGIHGLTDDEMGVFFRGCDAPNDAIAEDQMMASLGAEKCRVYRTSV